MPTTIRTISTLALALMLAGCQLMEQRPDEPEPEAPAEVEIEQPEPDPPRLSLAIDQLQDGSVDPARDTLQRYLAENPGHAMAQRLLEQLDHPPESFLGDEFIEVTVQPGDSLSGLAAEHAGDSLLFVALARLNGIQMPRLLQPGASLRVPAPSEIQESEPQFDSAQPAIAKLDAGDTEEGLELLISMARAGGLSTSGKQRLVDAGIDLSSRAIGRGEPDAAAGWLERIEPWVEEIGRVEPFRHQQDRIAARQTYESARLTDKPGERRKLLLRALELDPEYAAAARVLEALEAKMIDDLHDRALKAWRQQEVAHAAQLWEQLLEIDPEFEPAQVYLERAHEILDRLESL